MDVSIIYVNYYTLKLISDSIKTVVKFTSGISYEVIVVDNNTEDVSPLAKLCENFIHIQLDKNLGFGLANNEGAKVARGRFLLFLNPDTLLMNNAIYKMFEVIGRDSSIGVCGGNLYDTNYKPIHSYNYITLTFRYELLSVFKSSQYLSQIDKQHNFTGVIKDVEYVTGADLMICKDLFARINGFPQNIFMYYEDVDICYRVKKNGYRIISVPSAKIIHLEGQSFNDIEKNEKRYKMNIEGQVSFLINNYNNLQIYTLLLLAYSITNVKLLIFNFLHKNKSGLIKRKEKYKSLFNALKNR